jgi:hypothetical protein
MVSSNRVGTGFPSLRFPAAARPPARRFEMKKSIRLYRNAGVLSSIRPQAKTPSPAAGYSGRRSKIGRFLYFQRL